MTAAQQAGRKRARPRIHPAADLPVDAEGLDSDDLSWTLVGALRRAEAAKSPA
ncbi:MULTISPECIES: hypothetical protein [unclassified Streptomyces]|uniref:hypothetical protein n=1 Tax=unclassified Streptomyces TaxID=2593676 RepID=UPI002E2BB1EE|nr:hypothetical protein [Streptomyces sp. NBC_01439]